VLKIKQLAEEFVINLSFGRTPKRNGQNLLGFNLRTTHRTESSPKGHTQDNPPVSHLYDRTLLTITLTSLSTTL